MRESAAKVADEADGLDPQSVYGIAEDIRLLPIPERAIRVLIPTGSGK